MPSEFIQGRADRILMDPSFNNEDICTDTMGLRKKGVNASKN
jgi:hypothetical protein